MINALMCKQHLTVSCTTFVHKKVYIMSDMILTCPLISSGVENLIYILAIKSVCGFKKMWLLFQ